jgi:uncharacterized protein YukE
MDIIHMDVEITRDAADSINEKINEITDIRQRLEGAANTVESAWSSDKAEGYRDRIRATSAALLQSLDTLAELGLKMRMEVAQWQEADVMGAENMSESWSFKGAWQGFKNWLFGDDEIKFDDTESQRIYDALKKLKETDEGKKLFEEMEKNHLGFSINGKRVFGDKKDTIVPIFSQNLDDALGSYNKDSDTLKLDLAAIRNDRGLQGTLAHEMTHALDDQKGNLNYTYPNNGLLRTDRARFLREVNEMATTRVNSEVRAHAMGYKISGENHPEIRFDNQIEAGEREYVMDSADRNYSATYTKNVQDRLPPGYEIKVSFDQANNRVSSQLTNNNTHPPTVTTVP